jgi:pyruvate formate lyase activating enzyme
MESGIVFDIKRFALHDGPGIRTTVFLKGCPLSCLGCHNPEGQRSGPELFLHSSRCTLCGDCVPACPSRAITIQGGKLTVARDRCRLAGGCPEVCLPGALEIVGRERTTSELLEELEADRIYFDESGGGVTFSGGEPLSQPGFLRDLLRECREKDISAALDTSGHAEPRLFREVAPLARHVLFDLKLMDEARHEAYTGVHNRWILENLTFAGGGWGGRGMESPRLTVRLPLVPGFNDDQENLRATAAFLRGLSTPPPVEVLPYHRMGMEKYDHTGREFGLKGLAPPSRETVERAVNVLSGTGLTVTVRGGPHGHD